MLEVKGLSFDYCEESVLSNISCSLAKGRLLLLRGANGAGKSTLLRLLSGILQPKLGDIVWDHHSIYEDLQSFQRNICYVGHKTGLHSALTVAENCFFEPNWQSNRNPLYFAEILKQCDLKGLENKFTYQLSEGQKRRAALLRIVMSQASLWLLDEPYAALDKSASELLTSCLQHHLAKEGLVVMSAHQDLPKGLGAYETYFL